jgi:hypothetical protein
LAGAQRQSVTLRISDASYVQPVPARNCVAGRPGVAAGGFRQQHPTSFEKPEEQLWRHLRQPEAKRRAQRLAAVEAEHRAKQGLAPDPRRIRLITREESVRWHVDALWPDRKALGLGASRTAVVRRLIRKLKAADKAPS